MNGTPATVYQLVEVPDTFIRPDGSLKASYDQSSTLEGSIWMKDFGIDIIHLFYGFKSVLEMESYLEIENYQLYK